MQPVLVCGNPSPCSHHCPRCRSRCCRTGSQKYTPAPCSWLSRRVSCWKMSDLPKTGHQRTTAGEKKIQCKLKWTILYLGAVKSHFFWLPLLGCRTVFTIETTTQQSTQLCTLFFKLSLCNVESFTWNPSPSQDIFDAIFFSPGRGSSPLLIVDMVNHFN